MPASSVTIAQICDAIDTTLGEVLVTAGDLVKSHSYDELEEGMNDPNTLQIYPEEEIPVSAGSETHKITFSDPTDGPYIRQQIVIFADYYARQRSNIGEDMGGLVAGIDAIRANLVTQDCPNPFDLTGIASFQWSWSRVVFEYGGPELRYVGARFRLVLETF